MRFSTVFPLQKLLKIRCIFNLKGKQYKSRCIPLCQVILLNEAGNCRLRVFYRRQYLIVLVQKVATAEVKNCKASSLISLIEAHYVRICQSTGSDQLLLAQIFNRFQAVPQAGGQFKIQFFRGRKHLRFDTICHLFIVSPQELASLLHHFQIFCLCLIFLAPACTKIHMIVKARPVFSDFFWKLLTTARKLE